MDEAFALTPSFSLFLPKIISGVIRILSPVSSSLQLSVSLRPLLPSSSSLLQLIKSSVTSISSAKLSQLRTSVETSSSEILPKKPSTSSYSASKTLTIPSTEPSWVSVQHMHPSQNLNLFYHFFCVWPYS